MVRRFVLTAVAILALVGMVACARSPSHPSDRVDREVVLAPGQSAAIDEAGITIIFDRVTGDSRCPIDAICILGGDAIVRIYVSDATRAIAIVDTYELHTGDMKPVNHRDLTIALVDLTPYPYSARPTRPEEYRVTLRVTR